jgi:hypothetical protein
MHSLSNALNELSDDFCSSTTYLVLSGDISFQGKKLGYEMASKFIKETWIQHGGSRGQFLICPGNHDICDRSFEALDAFTYSIRRDHLLAFENQSVRVVEFENIIFLCINSAHHRDHQYGYVDEQAIRVQLNDIRGVKKRKIAVVHHHILGVYRDDTSAIRNSLQFISLLDEHNFELLVHGHQHAQADLVLGKSKIKVYSGRSLNFSTSGLVNGLAIYSIDEKLEWKREIKVISSDSSLANGKYLFTAENK